MSADLLFHRGEIELQERDGTREQVAAFAQRAIRPFMPDQHREFFQTLPFVVAGMVDAGRRPWATILSGQPGFVQSRTDTTLSVAVSLSPAPSLAEGLQHGAAIGLLGIELPTRRRNRANGLINHRDDSGFVVTVQESFGNCPKYIQTRALDWEESSAAVRFESIPGLNEEARALLENADTFFVASYAEENGRHVDVSHRGGLPGFVRVDDEDCLHVPDFIGNHMFNTLGNFRVNPVAGLVFPDFSTGDLLHLSGQVELHWEGAEVDEYQGAVHGWTFSPDSIFWLRAALPFRATPGNFSPFLSGLGPWKSSR